MGCSDCFELIESFQCFGAVIDELPGAFEIGVHFTFPVARSTAGTVEELLRTAGDRADPGELAQPTVAAGSAFLGDVGEMLVLFAASILFVVAIPKKEADRNATDGS